MAKRDPWADAPAEMTAAEYFIRLEQQAKRAKYGAEPCVVDGIRFASQAEARRYGELQLLERAGQIAGLRLQPRYDLPGGIRYIGDFAYTEGGRQVCEDVKGVQTQVFKLKAKLMRECYPDLDLRIITR